MGRGGGGDRLLRLRPTHIILCPIPAPSRHGN
ncbi:hypothetical protein CCACVL1_05230 [Corchorus capsularis]|uniref:Uncharacterized protein n=1 Tax=Corchorus capsularis TaxID=210143 RepID=A0A1R3JLW4_COCAP|nr:hypothetical protein CCACVL1_05230 [Corchorus capsularis]